MHHNVRLNLQKRSVRQQGYSAATLRQLSICEIEGGRRHDMSGDDRIRNASVSADSVMLSAFLHALQSWAGGNVSIVAASMAEYWRRRPAGHARACVSLRLSWIHTCMRRRRLDTVATAYRRLTINKRVMSSLDTSAKAICCCAILRLAVELCTSCAQHSMQSIAGRQPADGNNAAQVSLESSNRCCSARVCGLSGMWRNTQHACAVA